MLSRPLWTVGACHRTSSHAIETNRCCPLQPPDLRDWLPEDKLAWFVIEAIEQLHLEPFYGAYRSAGHGRAAHEPTTMLASIRSPCAP
ncbi:hypothetical protein [Streptomyces sp. NPDC048269]|uniref:hypothetical protein n=1 Tax=Streptomyces sp. NPDC048269 TaxID=3155753 RepID=UPI003418D0ED